MIRAGGGIAAMRYRGYMILRTPSGWEVRHGINPDQLVERVKDLGTAMHDIDEWLNAP